MSGRPVSFANFICKFGTEKNMLDVAEEIVIPAFLNSESLSPRVYSDTKYFLYQTDLLNLSQTQKPLLALAGRFVKDTTLRREQIYDHTHGLIKTTGKLESSPSAIFVLLLNNHKLIYCGETANAPSISSFRSTVYSYIRQQQKKFIDAEYKYRIALRTEALKSGSKDLPSKVTKKDLWEEFPPPELEIVPIPSALSLKEFIQRYKVLSSISLKVLQTNSELDNSQLLKSLRKTGGKLGAKNTSVTHSAGDRAEGLNKDEAVQQLKAIAMDGNVDVKLDGKDMSGNKLIGNNDEFKLKVYLEGLSQEIDVAALQLSSLLTREIKANKIKLADDAKENDTIAKIHRIAGNRNV